MVRITTDQYHQMIEQGIIPEDATTELLDGVIVYKDRGDTGDEPMGHGPAHRLAVRLLTRLAATIDSPFRHLQVQLPIQLSALNEPEPDGAVILGSDRDFGDHLPKASDVACIVEIAQSSLERDAGDKLPSYALAEIPQYVIVNLREGRVEVHADPVAGGYRSRTIVGKGQKVRLNLGKGEWLEVDAGDMLP
jgi:hypothetical protein